MNTKDLIASKVFSPEEKARVLTDMGYRRTSNSAKIISRIDRQDFVTVLAEKLRRTPACFYIPGEDTVDGLWCDHYRRCYSQDKIRDVPEAIFKLLPGSDHDPCGYVRHIENPELTADSHFFENIVEIFSSYKPPLEYANSEWPSEGLKWISDKGNIFTVVGISNSSPAAIYPTVNVIYRDQDSNLFSMPFSWWRAADYLMPLPKAGTKWRHKNNDEYEVRAVTNLSADKNRREEYPPMVSYRRLKDGTEWTRPLAKWAGSFTPL